MPEVKLCALYLTFAYRHIGTRQETQLRSYLSVDFWLRIPVHVCAGFAYNWQLYSSKGYFYN